MADVSQRNGSERIGQQTEPKHRGQLILVTALSLAILFVTLALILNTAIFTENLATRSSDIGGGTDAVRYHDASRDGVGGLIDYVNAHNNTSHTTLQSNLSKGIDRFRNHSARLFSGSGRAVEVSLVTTVNGSRIAQSNSSRAFTNETGNATDWTLVKDVTTTRAFRINVTDASTLEAPDSNDQFRLILSNATETWRINITRTGGTTTVGIQNGSDGTFECNASDRPTIDVTAGTVDGESCDGLSLADGLEGPYDIAIENGDNATGTYGMVVDNATLAENVATNRDLAAPDAGQPFAAPAVYSVDVSVVYETPRLYYETVVRVAPDEADG